MTDSPPPALDSRTWPIAVCMHGFPPVRRDGTALHDAAPEVWDDIFAQVARLGFTAIELADSHIRPADLEPSRRDELLAIAGAHGVTPISVHVQRQSVIQPGRGEENLAYAHRTIDASAELGLQVFSTGLHQPFTEAQRRALWFWTAPGPVDPDDADTRALAVKRLRELGEHAASVGLPMSLEMYEDTYLGTADSAVRLIEEIGLDNVGLNPDIANLIRLHRPIEDWREMHEKTLPYANYWHVKNYTRDEAVDGSWFTSVPTTMEQGLINYRAMVSLAIEVGFRGPFLMEQYGGDSLGVCATNRTYLQSLLPDPASE
ncbi:MULTISPECIES: sugar phosphate isomerase/epimerase family protein [Microbacterium]|uniref:sugar phosphate isomerase/epimerase family protein n=2 Tax=Microbacteriaceae TaxID=85023 RepID=UPI00214AF166|nr:MULTISPECIES: sugar phosphate isomerase/epimerase family protein [unclassified Microbacterium]MCR2813783.1 sugar phosphate isomerase/epimerase [Microbacterium sp. zg.Y1084]MDL5487551.1 sugar phosphate isomerase/epimerase family protein [Microbacterium sp. zg-Y1211]